MAGWGNKTIQIGGVRLKLLEFAGYLLFVVALVVYMMQGRLGFGESWIGWVALFAGAVLVAVGANGESGGDGGEGQ